MVVMCLHEHMGCMCVCVYACMHIHVYLDGLTISLDRNCYLHEHMGCMHACVCVCARAFMCMRVYFEVIDSSS